MIHVDHSHFVRRVSLQSASTVASRGLWAENCLVAQRNFCARYQSLIGRRLVVVLTDRLLEWEASMVRRSRLAHVSARTANRSAALRTEVELRHMNVCSSSVVV